ncbi:MAG: hypothetical protein WCJ81_08160 [bacterium]
MNTLSTLFTPTVCFVVGALFAFIMMAAIAKDLKKSPKHRTTMLVLTLIGAIGFGFGCMINAETPLIKSFCCQYIYVASGAFFGCMIGGIAYYISRL